MASELEARDLLYRLVVANGPYTVPAQIGIPEAITLDPSSTQAWRPRNVIFGNELAPAVPAKGHGGDRRGEDFNVPAGNVDPDTPPGTVRAWAHVRVQHETRDRASMSGRLADVRGNVEVLVHSRAGDQSAEAIGMLLARELADVLDLSPQPPRFSDGTSLYLSAALSEELPLAPRSKWHQFRITAPFTWQARGR